MKTNKTEKTKVLVIEDEPNQFEQIKSWLEEFDYTVLPEDFGDMARALDVHDIKHFVQFQLMEHYRDIGLILCDIKFGDDREKGNKIVKYIREFKDLSPDYWTSIVPIIGMTNYADTETHEEGIIQHGADFSFKKKIIFNVLEEIKKEKENEGNNKNKGNKNSKNKGKKKSEKKIEADLLRATIDRQVEKFHNNIKLFYRKGLENKIIQFKNENKNKKTAFIMTDFRHMKYAEKTNEILYNHNQIYGRIAKVPGGEFYGTIWENIEVFMHGCDFGICIYADDSKPDLEGNERDKMNPNVSIEVGYMLGLQKKICFLKHDSIAKLPSDFSGVNYLPFSDEHSLEVVLIGWLKNRGFIEK